jgi:hypothetical protein
LVKILIISTIKKCSTWRFIDLERFLEIIYKLCNHASDRRDFSYSAEPEDKIFSCGQRKWSHPHPDVHEVHRRPHARVGS